MTLYASVAVPLPLNRTFFYILPDRLAEKAGVGMRALVPFGTKTLTGFIVGLEGEKPTEEVELKEIREILDEKPAVLPSLLALTRRLSRFYHSSWGEMLQATLPPSFLLKSGTRYRLTDKGREWLREGRLSKEEKEMASILGDKTYGLNFLKRKYGGKNVSSLLTRMEKNLLVQAHQTIKTVRERREIKRPKSRFQLEFDFGPGDGEIRVVEEVSRCLTGKTFSSFLVHGSREAREAVYFHFIRKALTQSERVLFLVPEIGTSRDLIGKFEKKFGDRVAILHSGLSERTREVEWRKIRDGGADVIVGPRSALFAPVEKLRLIVVDEEQDESYFQQERPSYDARRGALFRADEEKALVVFGSETPSVETFSLAEKDGRLISLPERPRKFKVSIVDTEREKGIISRRLKEEIGKRLERECPVVLFLNRRGYASFVFCPACRYVARCPRCRAGLVYHKKEEKFVCHACHYVQKKEDFCPDCGSRLAGRKGAGIEAVEEELSWLFPQARLASLASDYSGKNSVREKILNDFKKGKVDILIGTSLLVHQPRLPALSLVGILNPENLLSLADHQAGQKTFEMIRRLVGFAEDDKRTEVIIQTSLPGHYSIRLAASGDYRSFFEEEMKFRRVMDYPPFSHMAEVYFRGADLRNLALKSREFLSRVKAQGRDIEVLGPGLPPVPKKRGGGPIQVILKSRKKETLDVVLGEILQDARLKKSFTLRFH